MKLLVVMADCTFPFRVGSAIVTFNNIKVLSKKYDITLIYRAKERLESSNPMAAFVAEMIWVKSTQISRIKKMFLSIYSILSGIPFTVIMNRSPAMERQVRELVAEGSFDAILLYEISAIQYCPPCIHNKMIVNIEDPQSIRLKRMRELPIWSIWEKIKLLNHEICFHRYEKYILPKLSQILLLSESDASEMRETEGYRNIAYAPYGVDRVPQSRILPLEARTKGMIVFSGNMYHPANIDGILFFLENIFSLVLSAYPLATLCVVGADPDIRIYKAAEKFGSSVVVTGKVKDISVFVRRATVCICPVRLKIGVQTKILEALSWGTPVVTTSEGNSGILGHSGKELWVENQSSNFAKRVAALLREEDWVRLSEGGRLLATRFSWERGTARVQQQIEYLRKECS